MIFYFHGADSFRSGEKISALKNKYQELNSSGPSPSVLDFAEGATLSELENQCASQGLFSNKNLVIVKNLGTLKAAQQKTLIAWLEKALPTLSNDENLTVLFWETKAIPDKSLLHRLLSKHAKTQAFPALSTAELKKWILQRLQENSHVTIEPTALELLLQNTEQNPALLAVELEKLIAFANGQSISSAAVENLVQARVSSHIFAAIEQFATGNRARALELLQRELAAGTDPFYLLSMYTYQIRTLLKIASFADEGLNNHFEIAKASKLHPFVVQKGLPQVKNLGLAKLKKLLIEIEKIDTAAKTGQSELVRELDILIVKQ